MKLKKKINRQCIKMLIMKIFCFAERRRSVVSKREIKEVVLCLMKINICIYIMNIHNIILLMRLVCYVTSSLLHDEGQTFESIVCNK